MGIDQYLQGLDQADVELHGLLDQYLSAVGQRDVLSAIRVIRELIAAAIFRQSDLLDEAADAGFDWDDISAAVGPDVDRSVAQAQYTFVPPSDRPPRPWRSLHARRGGLRVVLGKTGDRRDKPGSSPV